MGLNLFSPKNIFYGAIGITCFLVAIVMFVCFAMEGSAMAVVYCLPLAMIGGLCLWRSIIWDLADAAFLGIYLPNKKNTVPQMVLDPIRAEISQENFDKAIDKLKFLLEKNPADPVLLIMLADVYDKTGDHANTILILREYFSSRSSRSADDLELAMSLVDACLELDRQAEAVEFLQVELKHDYCKEDKKGVQRRLDGLNSGPFA